MDQIYQLQRQLQDLRQEVNAISHVASQLQHSETNNAAQLQRLQQNESLAAQQLQSIQQICNRLAQDVNAMSSVTQQVTSQMRPFTTGQFGAGTMNPYTTGQFGTYGAGATTAMHGPTQLSTFGTQYGNRADEFSRNQYLSSMAANRYGLGFNTPDHVSNQYISSMANQGLMGSQSNIGMGTYGAGTLGMDPGQSGYAGISTGNFTVSPSRPVHQSSQYGISSLASNQYTPTHNISQMSAMSQPYMGTGTPNIGSYSNF